MYIPFSPPDMTEREAELVKQTILSGWITSGPKKVEFENCIYEWMGDHYEAYFERFLCVDVGQSMVDEYLTYVKCIKTVD